MNSTGPACCPCQASIDIEFRNSRNYQTIDSPDCSELLLPLLYCPSRQASNACLGGPVAEKTLRIPSTGRNLEPLKALGLRVTMKLECLCGPFSFPYILARTIQTPIPQGS